MTQQYNCNSNSSSISTDLYFGEMISVHCRRENNEKRLYVQINIEQRNSSFYLSFCQYTVDCIQDRN